MGSNYFYIISSLPKLEADSRDFSRYAGLYEEVAEDLVEEDRELFRYVRYPIDNDNLVNLVEKKGTAFREGGNFNKDVLAYEIRARDTIPGYMLNFLEEIGSSEENLRGKIELLNRFFYDEAAALGNRFLRDWFTFERDLNNVLMALECRKYHEPIERRENLRMDQRPGQRLIGENEVSHNIFYNKALDFSLSGILPWMPRAMDLDSDNLLEYERDVLDLKLDILSGLFDENAFTLETILAWFIRLGLLTRWNRLDSEGGEKYYRGFLEQADSYIGENVMVQL